MEQSCNFFLYMIKMERQDTAYIELRVEIRHEAWIKESDSPHQMLSILLNYTKKSLEYSENTMETLAFDILNYCKRLITNHK